MRENILKDNESAFMERYGQSLQKRWDCIDPQMQGDARIAALKYDCNGYETDIAFNEESILRIVLGFEGRTGLEKCLMNALPTTRIVVWEPDETLFEAYCVINNISELIRDERIALAIGRNMPELENILKKNIYEYNAFHNKILAVGRYADNGDQYVGMLSSILDKVIKEVVQEGFDRKKFRALPCKNLIYTINTLSENYVLSQLFEILGGIDVPVIIVAAGPSLMKNCRELKKAQNKAVIVAVSRAVKTLAENGINPDFVAVTDAGESDYLSFDEERKYMLISSIWAGSESRKRYNGSIIFHGFTMVRHLFNAERAMSEPFVELDTGSVATDVFSLFLAVGFKRVILVGQDLAYDPDGYSHTNDVRENSPYEQNKLYLETEGINGGIVKTRGDWERFRLFFEGKIKANSDVHVIDATEGGALIHGTDVMTLADAIDKYCINEFSINNDLKKMKQGDSTEKEYIARWFDESIYNLEKVSENLDEILKLSTAIRNKWDTPELWDNGFNASCKRYDMLYTQILEGTRSGLINLYCIDIIQRYIENALVLEGDDNTGRRMEMEQNLFTVMKTKTEELLEYIRETINQ